MNELLERHEAIKQLRSDYRIAAARKYGVRVPHDANVQTVDGGAFIEVMVWVSTGEAKAFNGKSVS